MVERLDVAQAEMTADEMAALMVSILADYLVDLTDDKMADWRVETLGSLLVVTKVVLKVVPKDENAVVLKVARWVSMQVEPLADL
jgi:hypothetical protein